MTLYELALLGSPTDGQVDDIRKEIERYISACGMVLGRDVGWHVRPTTFRPAQATGAAAVFFGGKGAPLANVTELLRLGVPVVPVVSDLALVPVEIPDCLRPFNCLPYNSTGPARTSTALLECAGLLPRDRRVFLSYRRDEAKDAALQLFDAFSARRFDVFLDTHAISPGDDFQEVLWHRLCDSDVLVMLDTPTYFSSRWTSEEFGRALAKGIAVLRIGWPDSTPSSRTATASRVELLPTEVDPTTGRLTSDAVARACAALEAVRSLSHAARLVNLVSSIRLSVEKVGGTVAGVGRHKAISIALADGRQIVAYPTLGVPSSVTLHAAERNSEGKPAAVVYDPIGMRDSWLEHLGWLGGHVKTARWVKESEAAWQFAGW